MSQDIKDGGPAFACSLYSPEPPRGTIHYPGMSLRDWFAGQVISCLILSDRHHDVSTDQHAQDAYRLADAMIKAREAKP